MALDAPVRVLIVEDHPLFAHVLRLYLEEEPELIVIDAVGSAECALEHPHLDDVDVVLIDIGLPRLSGIGAVPRLRARNPALRVIVMSGQGNIDDVIKILRWGAVDYLRKPWNLTELMSAVSRALELRRQDRPKAAATLTAVEPETVHRTSSSSS